MEMNALMQALVKDLAEQMKPLINEQIAVWAKDNLPLPNIDLTAAELEVMARHVNLVDLAAELADSHSDDIAERISLSDLATEISLTDLAGELDLEDSIKNFFSDNSFTISP